MTSKDRRAILQFVPSATSAAPGKAAPATATPSSTHLAGEGDSKRYVVANQSAHRLEIGGGKDALFVLAPLERRVVTPDQLRGFRDEIEWLEGAGYVAVEPEVRHPGRYFSALALLGSALMACLIYGAVTRKTEVFLLTALFASSFFGLAWFTLVSRDRREEFKRWLDQQPQRVAEFASLGFVLLLSVALPGMALVTANGLEMREVRDLLLLGAGVPDGYAFAIGIRFFFIVALSMVPALLYFSFDREELATLRAKFIHQILRFDRGVETVAEVNAKYGRLMDEAYGRETATGRLVPTRRSPVLIATAVIALGWLTAIPLEVYLQNSSQIVGESAYDFLLPDPSPLTFAFLGAYFFALNAVLRGSLRGDLRPKTYSQITARIVVVAILGLVLGQLFGHPSNPALLAFAFLTGIVPETALVRIQEFARGASRRGSNEELPLAERHPLTKLEGIDIYDRARLMEEGVTNVEALAHHDLIDLMLKTRIPVPRLVDWVDQAILYLHADDESRRILRKHGVRTATDLESTYERARVRGEQERFLEILPSAEGAPSRVRVILDAISDEEWMRNLRDWRKIMRSEPDTIRYSHDTGLLRERPGKPYEKVPAGV